jgi:hypothetical protein
MEWDAAVSWLPTATFAHMHDADSFFAVLNLKVWAG